MSIELMNETKSVDILKEERTWRVEIFTDRGSDYKIVIHREISEILDGEEMPVDRENVEIPNLEIDVNLILASNGVVNYKDLEGNDKTFPIKEFPSLIAQYCDDEIERKKAESN